VLTVYAAESSDDESSLDGMNDSGSETETESDDDDADDDDDDASGEEDENSDTGLAPSGSPNNSRGHVLDEGTDAARGERNAAENGSVGPESDDGGGGGDGQFGGGDDGSKPGDHETAAFGNNCGAARDDAANWAEDANEQRTSALYNPSTNESEDDNGTGLIAAAPMDGSLLRSARGNGNDDDDDDRIGNHGVEDEGDGGYGPDGNDDDEAPLHCEERHEPPTAGVLDNGDPGEAFLYDGDVFNDAGCGTENGVYDIEVEVDRGSTSGGCAVPPDALAGAHPTSSSADDAVENQARPKRQYGSSVQQRSDCASSRRVKPRR
jgi:hypothetical protein